MRVRRPALARPLLGLGAVLVLLGCTTHRARILQAAAEPGFDSSTFRTAFVLPVQSEQLDLAESRRIRNRIAAAIRRENPGLQLVETAEAVERLRLRRQVQWAAVLENFLSSNVIDEQTLVDLGRVLEVDALVQCEVLSAFRRVPDTEPRTGGVVADPDPAGRPDEAPDAFPQPRTGTAESVARATAVLRVLDVRRNKLWKATAAGEQTRVEIAPLGSSAPQIAAAVSPALDALLELLPL